MQCANVLKFSNDKRSRDVELRFKVQYISAGQTSLLQVPGLASRNTVLFKTYVVSVSSSLIVCIC